MFIPIYNLCTCVRAYSEFIQDMHTKHLKIRQHSLVTQIKKLVTSVWFMKVASALFHFFHRKASLSKPQPYFVNMPKEPTRIGIYARMYEQLYHQNRTHIILNRCGDLPYVFEEPTPSRCNRNAQLLLHNSSSSSSSSRKSRVTTNKQPQS
jgi:hypothetical protein